MSRVRHEHLEPINRGLQTLTIELNRMGGGHRIYSVEFDGSVHTTLVATKLDLLDSFPKTDRRVREIEQALQSIRRDVDFLMALADGFDAPGDDQ